MLCVGLVANKQFDKDVATLKINGPKSSKVRIGKATKRNNLCYHKTNKLRVFGIIYSFNNDERFVQIRKTK